MTNSVITGATGFVGGYLVKEALAKGHTVFAIGRDINQLEELRREPPLEYQGRLNLIVTEITPDNMPVLEKLFVEHHIDTVIHAAGQASVGKSFAEIAAQKALYEQNPQVVRDTPTGISNIQTTEVLLKALKGAQKINSIKPHFHLVSTGDVFSQQANELINEQSIRRANTPYGWTKQFAEELVSQAVGEGYLTASVSYGPLIFGPHQRPIALLPIVSDQFIKGEKVTLRGDPLRETDAIDVRDFAKIVIRAITQDHAQTSSLERYVVSGHRTTIKEIFDLISSNINKFIPEVSSNYTIDPSYETPSDKRVDDSYASASFPDIYAGLIPLSKIIEDVVASRVDGFRVLAHEGSTQKISELTKTVTLFKAPSDNSATQSADNAFEMK